ncbi:hypothetical protein RI367_001125 [Sorochytrium milnesiophthora]
MSHTSDPAANGNSGAGEGAAEDPQQQLIRQLQLELSVERGIVKTLKNELVQHKKDQVLLHSANEQEEEAVTNRLIVRIEELQQEKARIIEQVEREEEYLTNTLQKKLLQLQKEKVEMENQLEQEQENIVNRLQKQLDALRLQQSAAGSHPGSTFDLSAGSPDHLPRRRSGSQHSIADAQNTQAVPPVPLIDMMRAEIQGLKFKVQELERDNEQKSTQLKEWRTELLMLRQKVGKSVDDLFNESRQRTLSSSSSSKASASHVPLFTSPGPHSRTPSGNSSPSHSRAVTGNSSRSMSTGQATSQNSQYFLGISPPHGRSRTASVDNLPPQLFSLSGQPSSPPGGSAIMQSPLMVSPRSP